MPYKIEVLKVENVKGQGKNGAYDFNKLHCVVHGQSDGEDSIVGVLIPPKDMPGIGKGFYEAEFGLAVDRDQKIVGQIKKMTPIVAGKSAPKGTAGSGGV